MIPSDHFVRYYNEVFKALESRGLSHLVAYWASMGELQEKELADQFRVGRLEACYGYWARILKEENCVGRLDLTEDFFELRMDRCPSLSKVLDNDAVSVRTLLRSLHGLDPTSNGRCWASRSYGHGIAQRTPLRIAGVHRSREGG